MLCISRDMIKPTKKATASLSSGQVQKARLLRSGGQVDVLCSPGSRNRDLGTE